jgi:hypothetical protein
MTGRCHHTGAALKTSGVEAITLAAESDALNLDGETFEEPLRGQLSGKISGSLRNESRNTQGQVLKQMQR